MKAFRKEADEFNTYIAKNTGMIPNYAARRRYGEQISRAFVVSTVNVGKRFSKLRQMRWSKEGAHLMLQMRAAVTNGNLHEQLSDQSPIFKSRLNWLFKPMPPRLRTA